MPRPLPDPGHGVRARARLACRALAVLCAAGAVAAGRFFWRREKEKMLWKFPPLPPSAWSDRTPHPIPCSRPTARWLDPFATCLHAGMGAAGPWLCARRQSNQYDEASGALNSLPPNHSRKNTHTGSADERLGRAVCGQEVIDSWRQQVRQGLGWCGVAARRHGEHNSRCEAPVVEKKRAAKKGGGPARSASTRHAAGAGGTPSAAARLSRCIVRWDGLRLVWVWVCLAAPVTRRTARRRGLSHFSSSAARLLAAARAPACATAGPQASSPAFSARADAQTGHPRSRRPAGSHV
jgi:hypothetical protein